MLTSNTAQPTHADDEISLIELWQILVRRKAWIALCFALSIFGGTGFAFLKAPVYEASVKLRIGQVDVRQAAAPGLLEPAEELSSRLMARYGEDVADGVKREPPFLKRAAAQKGVASTIDLVTEGDTPEDAAGLLGRVVDEIQKEHDLTFQQNLKFLAERLDHLNQQRAALEQQYKDATALLEQLRQRDAIQASLVMLERGRISTSISELDAEKPALTQRLSPPQTRPTELVGEITAPVRPASPRPPLVFSLAVVLGLIGGVALAFMAEFVANARSGTKMAGLANEKNY